MPTFMYEKIVRSGIPDLITNSGGSYEARTLTDAERFTFMGEKVMEEWVELEVASDSDEENSAVEAADLLEATESFVLLADVPHEEVAFLRSNEFMYEADMEMYGEDIRQTMTDLMLRDPDRLPQQVAHLWNIVDAAIDVCCESRDEVERIKAARLAELGGYPAYPSYLIKVTIPEADKWTPRLRAQPDRYPEISE